MLSLGLSNSIKSHAMYKKMIGHYDHSFAIASPYDKELVNRANFFVQVNLLKYYETNELTKASYNVIKESKKPSLVSESAIFREVNDGIEKSKKWYRLVWNSFKSIAGPVWWIYENLIDPIVTVTFCVEISLMSITRYP